MSEQIKILNFEQSALVAELTETYGIEQGEIIFFSGDPKPFFTYEATCALCNQLIELHDITIETVQNFFTDSLALKCTLTMAGGITRGAVGVANLNETIDGAKMTEQQTYLLASSRAIRNALRTAGIDLLKLHRLAKNGGEIVDSKMTSNYVSLIRAAHQLGTDAFLIDGDNKRAWYGQLKARYGVNSSNELSEANLADFVAFLKTLVPSPARAAA